MISRDEAFAQGFRLAWRYCPIAYVVAICCLLAGCGEPASTYDPHRGRWVDTEEYRRDQINREIDKRGFIEREPDQRGFIDRSGR